LEFSTGQSRCRPTNTPSTYGPSDRREHAASLRVPALSADRFELDVTGTATENNIRQALWMRRGQQSLIPTDRRSRFLSGVSRSDVPSFDA
jgi:hypothetical protein